MTATLSEKSFVLEVARANADELRALANECLEDLEAKAFEPSMLFRLSVIFGRSIDLFDSVQALIGEVITRLRAVIDSGCLPNHQVPEVVKLAACFWNICKKKAEFLGLHPVLDQLVQQKESASQLTEKEVYDSVARLLSHEEASGECILLSVAYYPFNDQQWYRDLMEDAVAYMSSRRGLTFDTQIALICLATHWEFPSRELPPLFVQTYLEKRVVCLPLKIGMLFMLNQRSIGNAVRRGPSAEYEAAIRRQFPAEVNEVVDALLE